MTARVVDLLTVVNSFAADFLAPSAGKNIYVREIKLQTLTFVNRAIPVANGTEGVLSTLVANGSETVSTTVAIGSERVKLVCPFERLIRIFGNNIR